MSMKLLKYVIFIISFALQIEVQAQELNATVRVQAPNLGLSDKSVIGQMEKSITEFLNNQNSLQIISVQRSVSNAIFRLQFAKMRETIVL